MPRQKDRARARRARLAAILERIEHAQSSAEREAAVEQVGTFLARIAAADGKVWPFLEQIEGRYPPDKYGEEERLVIRAVIAQAAAPHLGPRTPGLVLRRHKRAK